MRREAGRVSHWHPGSAQATLQRAAEVAGTEKAGATSFGIPDAEPLHRWRVLFGLATTGHAEQLTWHVAQIVERQARQRPNSRFVLATNDRLSTGQSAKRAGSDLMRQTEPRGRPARSRHL